MELRDAKPEDLPGASDLCLRSKAYWGYDTVFLKACRDELTLTLDDLARDEIVLADENGRLTGVAQVSFGRDGCFLEKLFVDPRNMSQGIGRMLFEWCVSAARRVGATEMIVEADPQAADFYTRMGCERAGFASSGSVSGRSLPRLKIKINHV